MIPKYKPMYREINIEKTYEDKLYSSLSIPSKVHSYSLCVEYMKTWFLSKFSTEYFHIIYVDGKHIFDDFRRLTKAQILKHKTPSLAIIPTIDHTFNRDMLDLSMYGLDMYIRRAKYKESFFKDKARKVYLGVIMEAISMNFTFKAKVTTRAQALDLIGYMKMAFRVGVTQGKDVDMDFHVPYNMMLQLAKDTGFDVKDNKVVDIFGFLYYINKNSQLPFLYKLRCVSGNNEFFIRVKGLYVHISTPDISVDDGEREGFLQSNFIVEMTSTVRFPCPKFYTYFSHNEQDQINVMENATSIGIYSLKLTDVPEINDKDWNQFMTTEYEDEDLTKPLEIDFSELMGDLRTIIDHTKSIFLSPDLFMEIKLFNNFKEQSCHINWDTLILKSDTNMTDIKSHISIYVDTEYVNTQLAQLEEYNKNRLI